MNDLLAWLTAIGTLTAAVVPAVLFMLEQNGRKKAEDELRTLRERERADAGARERALEDASKRDQAEHVHFWLDSSDMPRLGVLHAANMSDMPVTAVCLAAKCGLIESASNVKITTVTGYWRLKAIGPKQTFDSQLGKLRAAKGPAIGEFSKGEPDSWGVGPIWLSEARFTDAAGRRWARMFDFDGTPTLQLLTHPEW